MTSPWGAVEVTISMTVGDVLVLVERRWGGKEALRTYLDRHHDDAPAYLFWQSLEDHGQDLEHVVHYGQATLGEPSNLLRAGKLDLLSHLMAQPGLGVRELARAAGKTPATVFEQIRQLQDAGLVVQESKGPGRSANLRALVQELTIRVRAARA